MGIGCDLGMFTQPEVARGFLCLWQNRAAKACGQHGNELHPVLLGNCPRPAKCESWNQMGHPSSLLCFLPRPQGPSLLGEKFSVLGFVLRALTSSYWLSVQSQAHSRCLINICLVIMVTVARGR